MAIFPPAAHDVFHLDDLLTPEERAIRSKVRSFMEAEVAPIVADFWERAEFPHALVPKLARLNLGGATIKGYGCPGQSVVGAAMAVIEMARVDASMSTFLMVHNSLAMLTIGKRMERWRDGRWGLKPVERPKHAARLPGGRRGAHRPPTAAWHPTAPG